MMRLRDVRVRAFCGSPKISSGGPSSQMTPASSKHTLEETSWAKLIS
jgi:hypothetical protein